MKADLTPNNELQVKETWTKPEMNVIAVTEDTLGLPAGFGADGGIYS